MAKKSDYGEEILVTNEQGVTYDLNRDYTKAISQAKAAGQDTTQLEAQRQAKINSAAYGGAHKTGANESASYGTVYDGTATAAVRNANTDPLAVVRTPAQTTPAAGGSLVEYLEKWHSAAGEQQTQTIDYAVETAVKELERARQDATVEFDAQRDRIALEEAQARDAQALYAQRRGDRGGIAGARYDSISNTAAQNRLAVDQAQRKLATDTAREITDLRAQGEFEKAGALLELTEHYLTELISLEQWSAEFGLTSEKFYESMRQWAQEFELEKADVTGIYGTQPTRDALQEQTERLAQTGEALLEAGVMPSPSQLAAMGMTAQQAQSYIAAKALQEAAKKGGGGKTDTAEGERLSAFKTTDAAFKSAVAMYEQGNKEQALEFLSRHYERAALTDALHAMLTPKEYERYFATGAADPMGTPGSAFGTAYARAWSGAKQLREAGGSEEEVKTYLAAFGPGELTMEGYTYILSHLTKTPSGITVNTEK